MNYSIVIPIYKRSELLLDTLYSVLSQDLKPLEIIIIDNNDIEIESKKLDKVLTEFLSRNNLHINLVKSFRNSGAAARNIGANIAKGELIAFLDSDVILDSNYYSTLVNYFKNDPDLIGAQGIDRSFIESQEISKDAGFFKRFLLKLEEFFETGTLFNRKFGYVSPSLAVSHPNVLNDFEVVSQWISTCAGIFKKRLFRKYNFPNQFITYSNNEYIYFSYKLFLNQEGKMLYTSKAKYKDVQTSIGRINKIPLMYQIQVYDYFIFYRLFKLNFLNIIVFVKSRIGHLFLNLFRLLNRREVSLLSYFHAIFSILYPLIYLRSIIKGDLTFYNKRFEK